METQGWQKGNADSPDQSSNAPLIAQEVGRPAVTLSPSLISYQTHSSNKCIIFPETELQGRRWLMRMWPLLHWQIPPWWTVSTVCVWLQRTASISLAGAGIWGSNISRLGSKGNLQSLMWQGHMVLEACMCMLHGVLTYKVAAAQRVDTLRLYWIWAAVPCLCAWKQVPALVPTSMVVPQPALFFPSERCPVMLTFVSLCFRTILIWSLIAAVATHHLLHLLAPVLQSSFRKLFWCPSMVMFCVWFCQTGGDFFFHLILLIYSQWLIWSALTFHHFTVVVDSPKKCWSNMYHDQVHRQAD